MATSDAWQDFDQIRHTIKNHTVDKLKQILSGLNEECGTHFSKSGRKQEIIDRIVSVFDSWRVSNIEAKWNIAKAIVLQVRTNGIYAPSRMQPLTANHPVSAPAVGYIKPGPYPIASTSAVVRTDPYLPRKPTIAAPAPSPKAIGIRFKESPYFRIDQPVSNVVECPESSSPTDRRQQVLAFTLNPEQIAKLKAPGSKYQLRLFCTSSIFYSHSGFRSNLVPCPVEFPATCEVRVNGTTMTANLKGLKKKPGTAPPPELATYVRNNATPNRIEMVYVNSQQPLQSKKYYMVVNLVETCSVDELVKKLQSTAYKSGAEIKQKMQDSLTEDDDIVAGPQKMSLKCPLSFMRINTPCRSSKCVHSQCFDATSWYTMMEQTTTWLCPVCERTLDYKDLIVDGYFDDILHQTPDSVEDVIVEADGEWHTSENKFGSTKWKELPPLTIQAPVSPRKPPSIVQTPSRQPSRPANGSDDSKGKDKAQEIFVLDSDDENEDEGRVKRELSPSYGSSASQSYDGISMPPQTQSQAGDIIDLTLDSDDEQPVPPTHKRKASEVDVTSPTEQIWKKGRIGDRTLPPPTTLNPPLSGHLNGSDYRNRHPSITHGTHLPVSGPRSSPPRYASFSGNILPPPVFPNFTGRGGTSGPAINPLQLPPLPNPFSGRPNGTARWP